MLLITRLIIISLSLMRNHCPALCRDKGVVNNSQQPLAPWSHDASQRQSIYSCVLVPLIFFLNLHRNGNISSAFSLSVKDPDIQRRRDMCTVGRGERAVAAEFPRARGRRAVPGPGALGDGQHICFWGENVSCCHLSYL